MNVENDSMFIAAFMARLAVWARGGAHVLVLDHTGHGAEAQERPRGSSAKMQQADEGLVLDVLVPWSREVPGAVAVRAIKDRRGRWAEGDLVGVMAVTPDPEGLVGEAGMVRIEWLEPWESDDAAALAGWIGRAEEAAAERHGRRPRAYAAAGERKPGVVADPLGHPDMLAVLGALVDGAWRSLPAAVREAGLPESKERGLRPAIAALVEQGYLEEKGEKRGHRIRLPPTALGGAGLGPELSAEESE